MDILKNSENDREVENHLVLLLGYDCFEFIKVIVKNRDMVLYCTLVRYFSSFILACLDGTPKILINFHLPKSMSK